MNFRERIDNSRGVRNDTPANDNNEQLEYNYFGIDNFHSLPPCVSLRFADGIRESIPYSHVMNIRFDPSSGIVIVTSTSKIIITGRDLTKLYEYLDAYRVRYIQEHIGTDAAQDGLFVKEIKILED